MIISRCRLPYAAQHDAAAAVAAGCRPTTGSRPDLLFLPTAAQTRCGSSAVRAARCHEGQLYWHFTDMPAYRGALVEAWGTPPRPQPDGRSRTCRDVDPQERLDVMMRTLVAPQHWALERAMRVWALTDDAALASVQQSDGRVLRAVRQAFIDYGFDEDEAELRAFVVFAAGVGSAACGPASPPTTRPPAARPLRRTSCCVRSPGSLARLQPRVARRGTAADRWAATSTSLCRHSAAR